MVLNGIPLANPTAGGQVSSSAPYPPPRKYAKPIYMIGFPCSVDVTQLREYQKILEDKLYDYHVLVLRNSTDVYTAKIFSEQSDEVMDIKDIKKYIDYKTKS